ncbi:MAG: SDR family NAD(P)-dependent oxidoreductase [Thermodesulfobacteriota bacterium]|nr:SDR family NAD(P)-dependent oxidoreductase [Thermodesulfobacteriota bacterium]
MGQLKDKRVLVTGCCGTVGGELVRQLIRDYHVKELVGLDNNESELFFTQQRYLDTSAHFFLADIRDRQRLMRLFADVDIVFHAAAFKHVALCEVSPFEAVQTNIQGVQNVVLAATANKVKTVIFTSSDKAVNPTNVMGTSKLMGERLMTAANSNLRKGTSIFASTRFGNVLGSRGSVIPIFREQIRKGGPLTITDPDMTRFIMSIRQAVQLVIDSATIANGGEVFVTKMPVIRIQDLAEVMIGELAPKYGYSPSDVQVENIGTKPGEKQYEELMTDEEIRRSLELQRYFVVRPAFESLYRDIDDQYDGIVNDTVERAYHSANEQPLDQDALRRFLYDNNLLEGEEQEAFKPDKRFWG